MRSSPSGSGAATSFYSTFQQLTLSLGICTAAATLHVSTELARRAVPGFPDFSAAFWVVTAISLCSLFTNMRFDPDAGRQMSGARQVARDPGQPAQCPLTRLSPDCCTAVNS